MCSTIGMIHAKEVGFFFQNEGGSMSAWGAFCAAGTAKLAILEQKQNAGNYLSSLETLILPSAYELNWEYFKFKHNSVLHRPTRL